jgi:UDP-N-acetylenolpyruvoylglucosamine reductase
MDLRKVTIGGARMYEKQFLVLVVERNSSSADVKKLADYVQHAVREKLHIEIEPEVRIV